MAPFTDLGGCQSGFLQVPYLFFVLRRKLLKPSCRVHRWPGGNNLEGQSIETRWQWNATTGSLLDRPGREGDWSYINTE